jgi:L-asparaginase
VTAPPAPLAPIVPAPAPAPPVDLPEVVVLALGGTVQAAPGAVAAYPAADPTGLVVPDAAVPPGLRVRVVAVAPAPSAALDLPDLVALATTARALVARGAAGVVVTLGTDMLAEAAFALDLLWPEDLPLVVTAAMRRPGAPGADGPANVRAALQVATAPSARGLGCVVVVNDEVHAAWQVRKGHTSHPGSFRSAQSGPLGWVAEDRVRIVAAPMDRPRVVPEAGAAVPPVALVPAVLGDDGRTLPGLAGLGYAGVVVEVAGGGSVPPSWAAPLGHLAGLVPVVYATGCESGATLLSTYGGPGAERDLRARGLLPAGVLDGPRARVLLSLLLAAGADRARVRRCLDAFDRPTHDRGEGA